MIKKTRICYTVGKRFDIMSESNKERGAQGRLGYDSMMYYFFDDYGNCFREKWFSCEDEASEYCDKINGEYFCGESDI